MTAKMSNKSTGMSRADLGSEQALRKPRVVSFGELLWDNFPEAAYLGGSAANVAFHAAQLGAQSALISRVGSDPPGCLAKQQLARAGVDVSGVSIDLRRPTGSVQIHFERGEPQFTIQSDVAWDHIELNQHSMTRLAQADVLCLSTLAQRTPLMEKRLERALQGLRPTGHGKTAGGSAPTRAIVILDLNLRPPFFSSQSLVKTLGYADVVKLNESELQTIEEWSGTPGGGIAWLLEHFELSLVALTLGAQGARIFSHHVEVCAAGIPTSGGDPVGAGDAFVAALSVALAKGQTLPETLESANRYGAWVAGQRGAMPTR